MCVCRLLAASTHRRFLACSSAGNDPCVRPSCWKYNSNGIRICRHHCYHITILEPDTSAASPAEKPLKLRRDGRPLNNQLLIQEDATKGKRGSIVPITVMPVETMTNYGAAGSLRCNFDNQSLL